MKDIMWRLICAIGVIYFMIAAYGSAMNRSFLGMLVDLLMVFLIYKSKDLFKKKERTE